MNSLNRERRRRLIGKIRALKSKRVEAGATVEEAALAAEAAARLMAEHDVSSDDLDAADYDRNYLPIKGVNLNENQSHPVVYVTTGVMHLSGCMIYLSQKGFLVIGDEVGRTMAEYLFDMTRNVIDSAWISEKQRRISEAKALINGRLRINAPMEVLESKENQDVLRAYGLAWDKVTRRSFMGGMADRISSRMREMRPARRVPDRVVAELTRDKWRKPETSKSPKDYDLSAIQAGIKAGDSVAIGMGVDGQTSTPLRITSD